MIFSLIRLAFMVFAAGVTLVTLLLEDRRTLQFAVWSMCVGLGLGVALEAALCD